jgi:acyl-coenzyme A synthetase/AMP-(fatty) acid ligase
MTVPFSINSIDKNILDLLQGPKFPDKEFIRGGATFGEVYSMAAGLQSSLAARGKPGSVVCLAAEDKAIIAAALLASLAGGPTLLLPYAFSANALSQLQQTTGFTTAIADSPKEFHEEVQVLYPRSVGSAKIKVAPRTSARSELLRIFTGGSTGTPQIWSKTGENLFTEGFFLAKNYAVDERDCILATTPPFHIYGLLFSVILPLVSSASVVGETPSFPNDITSVAEGQKVTILTSVPAHYRALRDHKMALRLAFSSAGMLAEEDNQIFCTHNTTGIVEVYGSTETGGIATRNKSLGEQFFTPFSLIEWKVSNQCLAVRSPYVSPNLPVDAAGFFTTNDQIEARGAGQFSLQGRTDSVTKVGGKRVDLEEVSLLIKKQPGVTDCVVISLPDAGGRGHRIGALLEGGDTTSVKIIKEKLAVSLEPYALPRRIKKVEQIPKSKTGKYDWTAIVQLLEK